MWDNELAPKLRSMNPDVAIITRTLKTFGISEGGLDEMLSPLFKSENPNLGIYSKQDGIHLRAIATAATVVPTAAASARGIIEIAHDHPSRCVTAIPLSPGGGEAATSDAHRTRSTEVV